MFGKQIGFDLFAIFQHHNIEKYTDGGVAFFIFEMINYDKIKLIKYCLFQTPNLRYLTFNKWVFDDHGNGLFKTNQQN